MTWAKLELITRSLVSRTAVEMQHSMPSNSMQCNLIMNYIFCSTVVLKASIALCVTNVFLILTIIVNGLTTVLVARITGKQIVYLSDGKPTCTSVLKVTGTEEHINYFLT